MIHPIVAKKMARGFTLIELIIVIAIIALIAALIFPAVNASIRKARASTSLSNLRQIASACTLYASDHDARLPYGDQYHLLLEPYLQNRLDKYTVFTSRNADRQPVFDDNTPDRIPITYSMHGWLTDDGTGRGRPLTAMEKPASIILIADGNQVSINFWQSNWRFENPRSYVMESRRSDYTSAQLQEPVADTGPDQTVDNFGQSGWFRYCNNEHVACAFGDGHAALIKKGEVLVENFVP